MVGIIFHSHATTVDNEAGLASGHHDVALSSTGAGEAKQLGQRYRNKAFDVVFCSDLQRAYRTAELAFSNRLPIIKDARLRECDYGELTGQSKEVVKAQRLQHITDPFPDGESYLQVISRMKSFLMDLLEQHDGEQVMIIGHAGTRLGLEYWLNNTSLETALINLKKQSQGAGYTLTKFYELRIDAPPLD